MPASVSDGGVAFVGFTDLGKAISFLTVTAGTFGQNPSADFIGLDDVRYVASSSVPEPTGIVSFGLGAIGLLIAARRRRSCSASNRARIIG